RDNAFVQMLVFGVCRFYPQLQLVLKNLMHKPLARKEYEVHALLLIGLYQLMHMRVPDYAAIDETVAAVATLRKSAGVRGLINAILREYLRRKDALQEQINKNEEASYAYPAWLITAIKAAWP